MKQSSLAESGEFSLGGVRFRSPPAARGQQSSHPPHCSFREPGTLTQWMANKSSKAAAPDRDTKGEDLCAVSHGRREDASNDARR